jgi:hypothetical protein
MIANLLLTAGLVHTPRAAIVQIRISRADTRIPILILDYPARILEAKERRHKSRRAAVACFIGS